MGGPRFTRKEVDWLLVNHSQYETYRAFTTAFNAAFRAGRSQQSIQDKCSKNLGIKFGNSTVYKNGNVKKQHPVGTIKTCRNGNAYIKVQDSYLSHQTGYQEPYWLPIQKKVWIDHFGVVPDGKYVVFLDGNRNNLAIENLYCIDRKISIRMASNKWYTEDKELTLTAIKWCELNVAINNKLKEETQWTRKS